jgi:hypothetical protein
LASHLLGAVQGLKVLGKVLLEEQQQQQEQVGSDRCGVLLLLPVQQPPRRAERTVPATSSLSSLLTLNRPKPAAVSNRRSILLCCVCGLLGCDELQVRARPGSSSAGCCSWKTAQLPEAAAGGARVWLLVTAAPTAGEDECDGWWCAETTIELLLLLEKWQTHD